MVEGLKKTFSIRRGILTRHTLVAVDDVSFAVRPGTTVGLVGESGSGKSTVARCIIQLLRPTSGTIRLDGVDLGRLRGRALRPYRRRLQMVFQDPDESLNPRMTVRQILSEPLRIWHGLRGVDADRRIRELLTDVHLDPSLADRYPGQLSGGQQQRVGIARALAAGPEFLIFDEPTSALDVSVRAQILSLLVELQERKGLGYLLISHDLSAVRYMADEVVVLYLGRVVEHGPARVVLEHPQHPYTQALLAATQRLRQRDAPTRLLRGEVGNPLDVGPGCALFPRCPMARPACGSTVQQLVEVAPGHRVACGVVTGVPAAVYR